MTVKNYFQTNNWEIRKFSTVILCFQVFMLFLIFIDHIGINIPILRQLTGFIYLTFIPGLILLRILKIHDISDVEVILYSTGLSLSFIMIVGFLINLIYPLFGNNHPLSFMSVVATISVLIFILLFLAIISEKNYFKILFDRDYIKRKRIIDNITSERFNDQHFIKHINKKLAKKSNFIDLKEFLSPAALFLYLIPFLAIIGSYLVNYQQNNILLMFLIPIIGFVALIVGFTRLIPKKIFPLAIFIIAFSLLLHRSLVPFYLWGSDVQYEYYFSKLVLINGVWNWNISHPYNGILSTNILAPIYAIFCNLDILWIFKVIYQFIFALVPVGLYVIFKKQTNENIAFFSSFLFVSIATFYSDMTALARQEIAELFVVLVIMILVTTKLNRLNSSLLILLFSISIIVSHYSLSYLYLFIFIAAGLMIYITGEFKFIEEYYGKIQKSLTDKIHLNRYLKIENIKIQPDSKISKHINFNFILFFIVFTLAWYLYISNSSSFTQVLQIGNQISSNIITDFLNPNSSQGLYVLTTNINTLPHMIGKFIQLISQLFVIIGMVYIFVINKLKFNRVYLVLSIVNLFLLLFALFVPFFASSLNITRLYHISLIILAPFFVIGGLVVFNYFNVLKRYKHHNLPQKSLSIFLVINLLFASGFVYEITKDHPTSDSLSQNTILKMGTPEEKISYYSGYTPQQNVFSVIWLSDNKAKTNLTEIYAGYTSIPEIWAYINSPYSSFYISDLSNMTLKNSDAYVYIGYLELSQNIFASTQTMFLRIVYNNMTIINPFLEKNYKIYSNGGSDIYIIPKNKID